MTQELRIMEYNIHKLKNKMMIILLNKKNARNYNILMIQESWRSHERTKTCNSRDIDFVLKDNEKRIHFYINDRFDSNSRHNT